MFCDPNHEQSAKLPPPQDDLPCRKCGRGQYFDRSLGLCQFCPDGTFSSVNGLEDQQVNYACSTCPEGKAAVKVLEFEHFETMPTQISRRCEVADTKRATKEDCEQSYGWRVDDGRIDSGIGLIPGIKRSLVLRAYVIDETHGSLEINYQTIGFTDKESLTVSIDGNPRCTSITYILNFHYRHCKRGHRR
jgi:ribosomal protein S14